MKEITPNTIHPPFANYSHATEIPANWRLVRTSGQLGISKDDVIPECAYRQALLCFENIRKILNSTSMLPKDTVHISAYLARREYMKDYMRARDEFTADNERLPSSTLLIVSGFTRPEFKVEVEIWAAAPPREN
ncbi:MAG: Rid family hydrolase [Roseovarius sp.]|nr:Rid family hydrolase [Roseovarius sp.]MCY4290330.1 Rid family hydrolase [Roseovarius sp.]